MTDKFLTDLAAHAGCDAVMVSYRGYHGNRDHRLQISLHWGYVDDRQFAYGNGPTVSDAMNAALAAKRAREAELAA